MKSIAISLFFSLITLYSYSQSNKNYELTPFNNLIISGAAEIKFTLSDTVSLKVETTEKQFENVSVRQEDKNLYIKTKGSYKEDITFYLSAPSLKVIELSGASNFKTKNLFKSDSLKLILSGASLFNGDLNLDFISLQLSGASDAKLTGNVTNASVDVSGASSLKSYSLITTQADIVSSGASSVKMFVTEKVKASATGASSIKLKGNAKEIKADASSGSSISKIIDNGANSLSQNGDKNNSDSTFVKFRGKKVIIVAGKNAGDTLLTENKNKKEDEFKHWTGFTMGVNGYLSPNYKTSIDKKYNYMELDYSRSFNFQFNIAQLQVNLYKKYITLNTGFGFDYHIYALNNKTTLRADSNFTWGTIDTSNTYDLKKNRFRNTYLQVPLLLEFNTNKNPHKSAHIAVGVIGQYLISSRTIFVFFQNGNTFERTRKDNYNLNPLGLKAHVSLGYSKFTVFGEYNLTELFKNGAGPKLNAFTIGIRLVPFN